MSSPRSEPQPSLTERRKAATQLDIASAAAALFAERGPEGTTAEDIALRAGIALRTFYRYFRSKEDAVSPLLSTGGARWREALAAEAADLPAADIGEALVRAARASLTPVDAAGVVAMDGIRGLLRAAVGDPALRAVWYRVNQESEEQLAPVLGSLSGLAGRTGLEIKMISAGATDAIRLALEEWAGTDEPADGPKGPAPMAEQCMRRLLAWTDMAGTGPAPRSGPPGTRRR